MAEKANIIREILTSDVGSFSFVFALVCGAIWVVYFVTKHVTSITSSHKILTKSNEKLDSHIDEIRKDIAYIKGSHDIIKSNQNQLMQAHSPISLTEKGKEVAKALGADEIVSRNWNAIFKILNENIQEKNPYDIQQYCIEEISVEPETFFNKEDLTKIKKYAFDTGQPLELYTRMIAIIIRDRYFEQNNIDLGEIDKFEPNNQ